MIYHFFVNAFGATHVVPYNMECSFDIARDDIIGCAIMSLCVLRYPCPSFVRFSIFGNDLALYVWQRNP